MRRPPRRRHRLTSAYRDYNAAWCDPDALIDFVIVTSDFYGELQAYCELDAEIGSAEEAKMSMLAATILLAQLHCSPSASGVVDCWDAAKGAPVLKIEPNLFGGYDLRQSDGKLVGCERKASGETA